MDSKFVWFDMDGTIVDFYNVENWLDYLNNELTTPYEIAQPLFDMGYLISTIALLRMNGYKIGIVSWGSKNATSEFNARIKKAKYEWLNMQGLSSFIDKAIILPYGTNKSQACRFICKNGILVDDEENNLRQWRLGETIKATNNLINDLLALL